jgi:hypothetical protein
MKTRFSADPLTFLHTGSISLPTFAYPGHGECAMADRGPKCTKRMGRLRGAGCPHFPAVRIHGRRPPAPPRRALSSGYPATLPEDSVNTAVTSVTPEADHRDARSKFFSSRTESKPAVASCRRRSANLGAPRAPVRSAAELLLRLHVSHRGATAASCSTPGD